MRPSWHRRNGFALVELLVATLVGTLVLGAAIALLRHQGRALLFHQAATAAIGTAAWAAQIAARDVSLAGADPLRAGLPALVSAGPERLVVQADRNGDGSVDPWSAERITLAWSTASGGSLQRRLGRQSMVIASGVARGDLRFRYFGVDGAEILPGADAELAPQDLGRVRSVRLELGVRVQVGGSEPRTIVRVREGAALRVRGGAA